MKRIFFNPLIIVMIFTASISVGKKLEDLRIFLGRWISQDENSAIIEVWEKAGDFTYEGYSYSINKRDGTKKLTETLRIIEMSDEIFYLAKVKHNEFPVPFKLTESSESKFVFENPGHDFPKRMEYNFLTDEKLEVTVGTSTKSFKIYFEKEIENEK
ncbi:MAG: DUF6265 family protein [Melioribacteraceae bacterium]|nr:hypothetical protein [Melioribacteraceae bacterium]MDD3557652.1 DUF6265 family protein [Melioribacteraceae bacterium]